MDNQLKQAAIAYADSLVRYFEVVHNKHTGVLALATGPTSVVREELLLAERHLFKAAQVEAEKHLAAM